MNGNGYHKVDFLTESGLDGAGELKRTLDDILYHRRLKVNKAAERLGIAPERLYKYLSKNSYHNNLPAFLLPNFTKEIGPELLMYLAYEAGHGIYRLPQNGDLSLKDAVIEGVRAMHECSEALHVYGHAIEDGRISYQEDKALHKEIPEAVEALLTILEIAKRMRMESCPEKA